MLARRRLFSTPGRKGQRYSEPSAALGRSTRDHDDRLQAHARASLQSFRPCDPGARGLEPKRGTSLPDGHHGITGLDRRSVVGVRPPASRPPRDRWRSPNPSLVHDCRRPADGPIVHLRSPTSPRWRSRTNRPGHVAPSPVPRRCPRCDRDRARGGADGCRTRRLPSSRRVASSSDPDIAAR